MKVQSKRIRERIEKLSTFSKTDKGVTRFSYSEEDLKARKWLEEICEDLDLSFNTDPVGNIRARLDGKNEELAPILIGSHMDSVKNGGKYDGVVGVIGALEVLSVFREENFMPERSVELIIFAEEEGSNFGTTMFGSKALIGALKTEDFKSLLNPRGKSSYEVIKDFGLNPEDMESEILKSGDIYCMLELHIEQGIVLEEEEKKIGVVDSIAGMTSLKVTVKGQANHAGSTPMKMRKDALVASSLLISKIEEIAKNKVLETTVATVGTIRCEPNVANIIPGEVTFTVDIRDVENESIEKTEKLIKEKAKEISREREVKFTVETIGKSKAIQLSEEIIESIMEATISSTNSWMKTHSGAVHDAAMMAEITPVGMIFVPSRKGYSHCQEEYTSVEDISLGTEILLKTVVDLSKK